MNRRHPLFKSEAECDGLGTLNCYCGGDLCVCGEDGQDCFGCERCDRNDDDDYNVEDEPKGAVLGEGTAP